MQRAATGRSALRDRRRVKLKGLKRYVSAGKRYVYHRETGIALPADIPEDHPDFIAAYLAAQNGTEPTQPSTFGRVVTNSVADICQKFQKSRKFKSLSQGYQDVLRRDMRRLVDEVNGEVGKLMMTSIQSRHIEAQMNKLERNPGNQRLKTWRYLTDFAKQSNVVAARATDGVKANPEANTGGHIPWTLAEIETFRDHWPYGTKERLAFEIQYWAGARISDTRKLGAKNVDDQGWLNFVQQKTRSEVSVPLYRELPDFAEPDDLQHLLCALEAMEEKEDIWLATRSGNVRSAKSASSWFSKKASAAGLPPGRTSHGLRKSRMILHAENGATSKQIAAWSGHETLKEIERYIRNADRRRLLTPSALKTGKFL